MTKFSVFRVPPLPRRSVWSRSRDVYVTRHDRRAPTSDFARPGAKYIYALLPASTKKLRCSTRSSRNSFSNHCARQTNAVMQRLKAEAASLGANGYSA